MAKIAKSAKGSKPGKPSKKSQPAMDGFWDRPPLINMLADVLLIFSVIALSYAALLGAQRLPVFPLRQLVVIGEVKQVTPMQVEYAVRNSVTGNFFTINLDSVRSSFEKLPWVRHAEVRRVWPDGLEVRIEEQVAAARWRQADGEYRLVNTAGEVFIAASETDLPIFTGPEGSAAQMLDRQKEFTQALLPLGLAPKEMTLSLRQSWQVRLDNGLTLALGRDENAHPVSERLGRFVASYPELRQMASLSTTNRAQTELAAAGADDQPSTADLNRLFTGKLIDMRYPNGFAVRGMAINAAHAGHTSS